MNLHTWLAVRKSLGGGISLIGLLHYFVNLSVTLFASVYFLESGQNQIEAARTHFAWGQLCYDLGNANEARVHLEQAAHKFSESNAKNDLENVKELLALI